MGALATGTVIKQTGQAFTNAFRVLKTHVYPFWHGYTDNQGPLIIGIADGELSATEIEECIESAVDGPGDHPATERHLRPVWLMGQLQAPPDGPPWGPTMPLEAKPRWTFPLGDGANNGPAVFAYNGGLVTLTTGGTLRLILTHWGLFL